MRRTEAHQGVRMIKFSSILSRYEAAEFSQAEAAELLGIGERTFRRWRQRFEDEGEAGLLDRRLGKASGKRVPSDRSDEVEALYRTRYAGFTAKHFHEHLVKEHNFSWGYTWTKTFLYSKGLLEKAKRRGAHRRKRERRPLPGMMLHQDGSMHVWLAGQPALDLIVTLDDATSAIYSAFLIKEEGTASTFRALTEVFGSHGLPMSLYTDRGAHYFYTPTAGGEVDRSRPTQVGRALERLGVEHIAAYSPQARGRSERVFHTLQDRLVKELALKEIDTVEAANLFLRDVYIPEYNARFAVAAAQEGRICRKFRVYTEGQRQVQAADPERMARAGVPKDRQTALTKPEIAIEEIDRVIASGARFGCCVLADSGYGSSGPFRQALSERGLLWAVGLSRRQKDLSEISCEGHNDGKEGDIVWRDGSNRLFPTSCLISFWREPTRRQPLRRTGCSTS